MTKSELEQIRRRADGHLFFGVALPPEAIKCIEELIADRLDLIAEIDRLRAGLREAIDWIGYNGDSSAECRARARLRALLEEMR